MATELTDFTDFTQDRHGPDNDARREPETGSSITYSRLPPADGGRQAWTFLAASFVLEGIVWGLPFSFGVFQVYYTSHEPFASQSSSIAAIGTTATGVAYFSSPFLSIALQRWPWTRRPAMVLGLVIMAVGLAAASFCNSVLGLIATQGVVYGIGSILLYFPANLFLDEWFVARKGLAFGTMWAGTGCAGVIVPFVMEWLLGKYGFRIALRVWVVVTLVVATPCLFLVKPRLPVTTANALRPQDFAFFKRVPFWIFMFGNIAYSLGIFLPSLWMPSYAAATGLPAYAGPLSLAFYNGGYSLGGIFLGHVADRVSHISIVISITAIGSTLAAFVLWGFAMSQGMLYCFAILWGIFGGGNNATWPGSACAMNRHDPANGVDTGTFIGLMAAGRGIGGIISGPLSEKLLHLGWHVPGKFAYGTSYGILVIFCGVSATFGGAACVGRLLKLL
ncbi:Monocarboxylate transporter 4 [Lecanosticta acicola]|uniref:Monocarboxylate transporter 4 n=1 Tax=Lecanosticta acicola TaxID=111012 RepID=A0AAI8YY19_9PEZI|nr:Monocarboxylate transporter 4 [Lecanosticta acicola]